MNVQVASVSSTFQQVLRAIAMAFSAVEKVCITADNLATVAAETSGTYVDEARIQRQAKLNGLNAELKKSQQLLENQPS